MKSSLRYHFRKRQSGFNQTEFGMMLGVGAFVTLIVAMAVGSSPTKQDQQSIADDNLNRYVADNRLQITRKSCASDSDGDGYGSCSIALSTGERVWLQCPVKAGLNCKEVISNKK